MRYQIPRPNPRLGNTPLALPTHHATRAASGERKPTPRNHMHPLRTPSLKTSDLTPDHLNLRDGERVSIICPHCGTWRLLHRHRLPRHEPHGYRCPGTNVLVHIDETPEQWQERRQRLDRQRQEHQDAGARRISSRKGGVYTKPDPPVPPAVHQLARR